MKFISVKPRPLPSIDIVDNPIIFSCNFEIIKSNSVGIRENNISIRKINIFSFLSSKLFDIMLRNGDSMKTVQ